MKSIGKNILKSKAIKSFSFLLIRETGIKIFALLGQIFLARILLPTDFGIFAIFSLAINFLSLISTFGLNFSIIQKEKKVSQKDFSSIFYIQELISVIFVILIFSFGNYLIKIYPSLNLNDILIFKIFTLTLLITPYSIISTAILERKIDYKKISIIETSGVVVYEITAVLLAFFKMGLLSLIMGVIIKEIFQDILLFILERFTPLIYFNVKELKKMINFGLFIEAQGIITLIINSLNPLIIGLYLNTYYVGIVDFAGNVGSAPSVIADNLSRVSFSTYSRIQKQKKSLVKSASISITFMSSLYFFILFIIFTNGFQLINIIFTSKWQASLISIYFFSVAMLFYALKSPLIQIILALGKAKIYFWINFFVFLIQVGITLILIKHFSYNSIAIASSIVTFLSFIIYLIFLKYLGIYLDIIKQILIKFFIFLVSLIFNFGLIFYLGNINLWDKIVLDSISYLLFYLLFCREEIYQLMSLIKNL